MFFFLTEKIKSCEGLLDVTWLTLLVQKEFIQPVKKNFEHKKIYSNIVNVFFSNRKN